MNNKNKYKILYIIIFLSFFFQNCSLIYGIYGIYILKIIKQKSKMQKFVFFRCIFYIYFLFLFWFGMIHKNNLNILLNSSANIEFSMSVTHMRIILWVINRVTLSSKSGTFCYSWINYGHTSTIFRFSVYKYMERQSFYR